MAKKRNLKMWVVMSVLLAGMAPAIAAGGVIYVDADASTGGDGQTWATAYKYLQDGLGAAVSGDEVWVAEGIYKPDEGDGITPGNRYATFQLKNGVAIKGGYAGFGEPDPNARDVEVYETVLSGDLLGNDGPDFANNYENSYHVVTGSGTDQTAVLDGFTIRGGNANGSGENRFGGGMYNRSGSPTLTNCMFTDNTARAGGGMGNRSSSSPTLTNCTFSKNSTRDDQGGGMANWSSSPTLTNCTFSGNSANSGGGMHNWSSSPTLTNCTFSGNSAEFGGGMTNYEGGSPTLSNCKFIANSAGDKGGGMYNLNSSPTLTNCVFSGNSAALWGGGGMANWTSTPTLANCTFSGNSADRDGGGMWNYDNSSPTLTNCTFNGNSASYVGGMANFESSNPTLTNCTFSNNSAYNSVGGMLNQWECSPTLTNCTFIGNSAGQSAGGMDNYDGGNPTLTNCTFIGNSANVSGGGMVNELGSSATVTNCILWGNTAPSDPQIHNDGTSSATVSYSDVQGGWPGETNIDADPYFADPYNGDCHLRSEAGRWDPVGESWIKDGVTSPCIDRGSLASDWTAELWPHGERINMGAYGGTPEASMSLSDAGNIADLNIDGWVGYGDMMLLTDKWIYEEVLLSGDLNRDGIVTFTDFAIFAHNWLAGPPPGPASNPEPANDATDVDPNADLSWTAASDAISHDVYFGTSSPGTFQGNQTDTIFDPGTMVYSSRYYWRIDAVGAYGKTTGEVWSFTTIYSDLQASNPNPADGATTVSTTADLSWTAGVGATSHDVYFGTSSTPPSIGNQAAATFDPGTMAYSTTYYWRIDETGAYGTITGTVWSFTTTMPPPLF